MRTAESGREETHRPSLPHQPTTQRLTQARRAGPGPGESGSCWFRVEGVLPRASACSGPCVLVGGNGAGVGLCQRWVAQPAANSASTIAYTCAHTAHLTVESKVDVNTPGRFIQACLGSQLSPSPEGLGVRLPEVG